MSLRIRRGTDTQRQQITFDQGELVYTTDTLKLFVGDGITPGGVNAMANMAGTGLVFDSITQTLQSTGGGGGGGSGITSVSQDSSPALGGNLSLSSHNITGTGNISISGTLTVTGLGADLNLNSHNIAGTGNIGVSGTLGTASLTVSGSTLTTSLGAPTTSGYTINGPITVGSNSTPASLLINSNSTNLVLTNTTNGTTAGGIAIKSGRGTLSAATVLVQGDPIAIVTGLGYDGAAYQVSGSFGLIADPNSSITSGHVPGAFGIVTVTAGGGTNQLLFDSHGVLNAPVIQVSSYAGTGLYPGNPAAGWIIFDSTNSHFYGFNGTIWKQLDN